MKSIKYYWMIIGVLILVSSLLFVYALVQNGIAAEMQNEARMCAARAEENALMAIQNEQLAKQYRSELESCQKTR